MFKLSKLLHSRSQFIRTTLVEKYSRECPQLFDNASQTVQVAASRNFATGPNGISRRQNKLKEDDVKVFAQYSIFKGKGALTAKPILPTFKKTDSGDLMVDRQGIILLTFSPALGERKYDSEKRKLFALSPTEVGSLMSLGATGSCEFFHDPSMKSSAAGNVRKSLSIKAHADGTGYMMSLSVVDNVQKTNDRVVVPVTTAEFATLRTAVSFALPYLLGWDRYLHRSAPNVPDTQPKMAPRFMDREWDR